MNTRYSLRGAAPSQIADIWLDVAPLLADALARGSRGYTLEDVLDELESGRAMLWLVVDGEAIVAAAVVFLETRARALQVWLMGGRDMPGWLDILIEGLARYAREMKLKALQADVRPGLVKVLKSRGWQPQYTTVRMPIWAD
jgi:hypothetical protein